jgi:hypothetical protein
MLPARKQCVPKYVKQLIRSKICFFHRKPLILKKMLENQNTSTGMVCRVLGSVRDMSFDPRGKARFVTLTAILTGVIVAPVFAQEPANAAPVSATTEAAAVPDAEQVAPDSTTPVENPAPEVIPADAGVMPVQPADSLIEAPPVVADSQAQPEVVMPPQESAWFRYLTYGADTSLIWDSNVFQASGKTTTQKVSDLTFGLDPWVGFKTDGSKWQTDARVGLTYDEYLDNSQLDFLGYGASLSSVLDGAKALLQFDLSQSQTGQVDRYYGAFVERDNFSTALKYDYKYSAKSSIDTRFGYSSEAPLEKQFNGSEKSFINTSLTWQLSPITKLSGGLGWTSTEGDRQVSRTTIGPVFRATYKLSEKVSFDGELGLDYVEYSGKSAETGQFVSSKLDLAYVPSPFWKWTLGVLSDTIPDGSQAGVYRKVYAVKGGLEKRISRSILGLDLSYEENDLSSPTNDVVIGANRNYFALQLSLRRNFFSDKLTGQIFCRYRDEESSDTTNSWNGSQVGVTLKTFF